MQQVKIIKPYKTGLDQQKLDHAPRLATQIEVDNGWETAVETVLGNRVEAVCVSSCQDLQELLPTSLSESLTLIELRTEAKMAPPESLSGMLSLSSKVSTDWAVDGLLSHIYCASDSQQAQAALAGMSDDQSLITADGAWFGQGWLGAIWFWRSFFRRVDP